MFKNKLRLVFVILVFVVGVSLFFNGDDGYKVKSKNNDWLVTFKEGIKAKEGIDHSWFGTVQWIGSSENKEIIIKQIEFIRDDQVHVGLEKQEKIAPKGKKEIKFIEFDSPIKENEEVKVRILWKIDGEEKVDEVSLSK